MGKLQMAGGGRLSTRSQVAVGPTTLTTLRYDTMAAHYQGGITYCITALTPRPPYGVQNLQAPVHSEQDPPLIPYIRVLCQASTPSLPGVLLQPSG